MIFADREASFIFRRFVMVVISVAAQTQTEWDSGGPGVPRWSLREGVYLLARATSHCSTASRFVSSFALMP